MTNLKTKKSHFAKSKILLIILCIFGLAFSYSCSCRDDNPYQPEKPEIDNNGLTGGVDNGQGGKVYTPSVELSTNFMVVNSKGDGMKTTISAINLKNATVKSVSLNNQNITLEYKNGVISITKGFDQIATDKKPFELTIEFEKHVETLWKNKSSEYQKYCDGVIWVDAQGAGTPNLTVYLKFKFKSEVEVDNPDQEYIIKAPMKGLGKWIN